jgi:hypothetical protein
VYQRARRFVDLLQNLRKFLMRNNCGGVPIFGSLNRINHGVVRQRKIQPPVCGFR